MTSVFSCVYCGASVLWVHLMKSQPSLLYWIFNGCSFHNLTSLVCILQSIISDNDRLKSDRSYVSKWLRGGERHGISNFPNKLFISYTDIFRFCLYQWSEVAQSCPTLCDPMDYGPPGSSIHGIFQASVLEWVTISFSRVSSWPRDRTGSPALQADTLPSELPEEPIFVTYTDEILTLQWCKVKPCIFLFLLLL